MHFLLSSLSDKINRLHNTLNGIKNFKVQIRLLKINYFYTFNRKTFNHYILKNLINIIEYLKLNFLQFYSI